MPIDQEQLQEQIQKMINQVEHLNDDMLYSGLTILAKDINEYKGESRSMKDEGLPSFYEVFNATMGEERSYWEVHGNNLFVPLADQQQPHGFARLAEEQNQFDLSPLTAASIHHEWFNIPGRKMFRQFADKFRDTICEKGGPRDQFKGFVQKNKLPAALTTAILSGGFTVAAFWYPIAVYVGLLIARTGLDVYCEPKKKEEG